MENIVPGIHLPQQKLVEIDPFSPSWLPHVAGRKRPAGFDNMAGVKGVGTGIEDHPEVVPQKVARHEWSTTDSSLIASVTAALADAAVQHNNSVPNSCLIGDAIKTTEQMPPTLPSVEPEQEIFVAEIKRIRCVGSWDFRRTFDLDPNESWDMQLVQTRYRQLMRLLHPDKRCKAAETRAGGRTLCDEAVELVQQALQNAKRELNVTPDSSQQAQQSMRRLQEVQRQRARQAMQRQQQAEVGRLSADIDRALAGNPNAPSRGVGHFVPKADPPDATARQIVNLLSQMVPPQRA